MSISKPAPLRWAIFLWVNAVPLSLQTLRPTRSLNRREPCWGHWMAICSTLCNMHREHILDRPLVCRELLSPRDVTLPWNYRKAIPRYLNWMFFFFLSSGTEAYLMHFQTLWPSFLGVLQQQCLFRVTIGRYLQFVSVLLQCAFHWMMWMFCSEIQGIRVSGMIFNASVLSWWNRRFVILCCVLL